MIEEQVLNERPAESSENVGEIHCHVGYKAKKILAGFEFRTINGMAIGSDGRVWVASAFGECLFTFDRSNGRVETVIDPPLGASDDMGNGHGRA